MSLHEVWQAAASSPFEPAVGKDSQLYVGFLLLLVGLILTGLFGLSMSSDPELNTADIFRPLAGRSADLWHSCVSGVRVGIRFLTDPRSFSDRGADSVPCIPFAE